MNLVQPIRKKAAIYVSSHTDSLLTCSGYRNSAQAGA